MSKYIEFEAKNGAVIAVEFSRCWISNYDDRCFIHFFDNTYNSWEISEEDYKQIRKLMME